MKIEMIKLPAGILHPANDTEEEALSKFKNFEQYQIDIKNPRNPKFHRMVFEFLHYCFKHWQSDREFIDEKGQFEVFRKHLICLAGYYDSFYNIKGEVRIEAKSLSFGNMDQEEFEQCYNAMIQAAMKHLFRDMSDDEAYKNLYRFFS